MRDLLEALGRFLEAARVVERDRTLKKLAAALEAALAKAFKAQGAAFVKRLAALRKRWESLTGQVEEADGDPEWTDWESRFAEAYGETQGLFVGPLMTAVETALQYGAATLIGELGLGITFDLQNPRAIAYIEAHGAELVAGVDETTKEQIRTVIHEAQSGGWSYDKLARALLDRWKEFAEGRPQEHIDSRAHGIAVTELGNAYAEGNYQYAQQLSDSGLEIEKSWLTVGDDKVSEICLANEAEGWIPLDQEHSSGNQRPLAHPYCRCDELYRQVEKETDETTQ